MLIKVSTGCDFAIYEKNKILLFMILFSNKSETF